jgi:hypothetical protein
LLRIGGQKSVTHLYIPMGCSPQSPASAATRHLARFLLTYDRSETVNDMRKSRTEKSKDAPRRCADCGAVTESFLCDRCAEICDQLTVRGEYWFRRIRPAHEPRVVRVLERGTHSSRIR